jgi:cobalt-zinc-cadmium efflux system protein
MSEHHDHSHAVVTEGNSKKLMFALGLTTTFLIVEVVAAFPKFSITV